MALLPRISGQERIWLHWGMTALAYPFFRDIAEVVGRLLALQDDFTTAQVQGRMLTTWGDRATSKEAAQKLITTLVDWEVLRSTKTKGHFLLARKMTTSIPDLQLWLLEALLGASAADEIEAQQLLRLPESFPFTFSVGVADLRKHEGFNIHRQGLDMDMVALRKVKLEPPPTADQASLFDMRSEKVVSNNGKQATIPVVPVEAHAVAAANLPTTDPISVIGGTTATPHTGRLKPARTAKRSRFHGSIQVDPLRLGRDAAQIAEEIVKHLSRVVGSNVEITIEIKADLAEGANDKLVHDVTENCRTLKFGDYGFEEE